MLLGVLFARASNKSFLPRLRVHHGVRRIALFESKVETKYLLGLTTVLRHRVSTQVAAKFSYIAKCYRVVNELVFPLPSTAPLLGAILIELRAVKYSK